MSFYSVMNFLKKSESAGILSPVRGDVAEALRPLASPVSPMVTLSDLVSSELMPPLRTGLTVEKTSLVRDSSLASLVKNVSSLTELQPDVVTSLLDPPLDDAPITAPLDGATSTPSAEVSSDGGQSVSEYEGDVEVDAEVSPRAASLVGSGKEVGSEEEDMEVTMSPRVEGEGERAAGEGNQSDVATDMPSPPCEEETVDPTADESCAAEAMEDSPSSVDDEDSSEAADGTGSSQAAGMPAFPVGGPAPIEIVISFDTTGSMSAYLDAVRATLRETLERLFADIPWLRVAIIAHGDYCDESLYYLTQAVDFTNDLSQLCQFVGTVSATGGGDWEECYEFVLQEVRRRFSWTAGTQRALIMIGDAVPHETNSPQNKSHLDWRQQLHLLHNTLGVRVYAVQCGNSSDATWYWKELAARTAGAHLQLSELNTLVQAIMAVCYREMGHINLKAFEHEVGQAGGHVGEMSSVFSALHGTTATTTATAAIPVTAPTPGTSHSKCPGRPRRRTSAKMKVIAKSKMARGARKRAVDGGERSATSKAPSSVKKTKVALGKTPAIRNKNSVICRQPREVVSEASFIFNKLKWSPWKLAIAPSSVAGSLGWSPRQRSVTTRLGADVGVVNTALFRRQNATPAVYELAVQRARATKRYVTYVCCAANIQGHHWHTRLLRHAHVNKQIDDVIRQGCSIYIRRAPVAAGQTYTVDGKSVSGHQEMKLAATRKYSYAWSRHQRRDVTRQGVLLANKQ